jgi:hypothetical protein
LSVEKASVQDQMNRQDRILSFDGHNSRQNANPSIQFGETKWHSENLRWTSMEMFWLGH